MRIQLLTSSAALLLGLLSASASLAQTQNASDISGPLGSMTCSAFTAMDSTAQAAAINQVGQTNPAGALTSNSGASSTTANDSATVGVKTVGTPINAGTLIAACQAATPSSTVHDAYSGFSSGNMTSGNMKAK